MIEISRDQMKMVAAGVSVSGEGGAAVVAVGAGVGAASAITSAGGLAKLGSSAPAVGGAYAAGLGGSYAIGNAIGSYAYQNSEAVRETAGGMVASIMERGLFGAITAGISQIFGFGGGSAKDESMEVVSK